MDDAILRLVRFGIDDLDRTHEFYADCLSMSLAKKVETETHTYVYYTHGKIVGGSYRSDINKGDAKAAIYGLRLEKQKNKPGRVEVRCAYRWHLVFFTRRLGPISQRLAEHKFPYHIQPIDAFGITAASLTDPNGVPLRLIDYPDALLKSHPKDEITWTTRLAHVALATHNPVETVTFYHRLFSRVAVTSVYETLFSQRRHSNTSTAEATGRWSPAESVASSTMSEMVNVSEFRTHRPSAAPPPQQPPPPPQETRTGFTIVDRHSFPHADLGYCWLGSGPRSACLTLCVIEKLRRTAQPASSPPADSSPSPWLGLTFQSPTIAHSAAGLSTQLKLDLVHSTIRGIGAFFTTSDPNDVCVDITDADEL